MLIHTGQATFFLTAAPPLHGHAGLSFPALKFLWPALNISDAASHMHDYMKHILLPVSLLNVVIAMCYRNDGAHLRGLPAVPGTFMQCTTGT